MASLRDIGFEYYYGVEQRGWILYLEGETDLRILYAFAQKMEHASASLLQDSLVKYVTDLPQKARRHFACLKEAKSDLRGFLLLDRKNNTALNEMENFTERMWTKNEIENYLCHREAIISYVTRGLEQGDLFDNSEILEREKNMNEEMNKLEEACRTLNKPMPFSDDIKASDDFLVPLFENFAKSMRIPLSTVLQKTDLYKLVEYIPIESMDNEVTEILDTILEVSRG